jgi:MFS family permease
LVRNTVDMTSSHRPHPELRRARAAVGAAFALHAAAFATWATRVPAIKHGLGLTDGQLGIALFAMAAGLLAGTRLAAWPVERLGSRPVTRVGALCLCALLPVPALAPNLAALMAALALFGLAGGLTDVAMNAQAVAVERAYARPIMSSLHGMWSLAGLVMGGLGAAAAAIGASPELHFGLAGAVLAAAGLLLLRPLLDDGGRARPHGRRTAWTRPAVAAAAITFASFVGEGSAADWGAVYLRDQLGAGPGLAASAFVAFALAMTACRFVADRLVARFGPVRVVRTGALLAAAGLAGGLLVQATPVGLLAFALLGAGLAPVVPTAVSAAGHGAGDRAGTVVGRVIGVGYAGSVAGPLAIGLAAGLAGLRVALVIPVLLAVAIAAAAGGVRSAGTPRRSGGLA